MMLAVRQAGFTLLETLVAMLIISIALLAISRAGQQQISQLQHLRNQTLAQWVADNAVAEARLNYRNLQAGFRSGSQMMGQQDWLWEMHIQTSPDPGLWRLDVQVRDAEQRAMLIFTGFARRHE